MSLDIPDVNRPLAPAHSPTWGELTPAGEPARVVRFMIEALRTVTYPAERFSRWEHVQGVPEVLTITVGSEQIVVEGSDLSAIRAALDLGRLTELRTMVPLRSGHRPGPYVRRIVIEST